MIQYTRRTYVVLFMSLLPLAGIAETANRRAQDASDSSHNDVKQVQTTKENDTRSGAAEAGEDAQEIDAHKRNGHYGDQEATLDGLNREQLEELVQNYYQLKGELERVRGEIDNMASSRSLHTYAGALSALALSLVADQWSPLAKNDMGVYDPEASKLAKTGYFVPKGVAVASILVGAYEAVTSTLNVESKRQELIAYEASLKQRISEIQELFNSLQALYDAPQNGEQEEQMSAPAA